MLQLGAAASKLGLTGERSSEVTVLGAAAIEVGLDLVQTRGIAVDLGKLHTHILDAHGCFLRGSHAQVSTKVATIAPAYASTKRGCHSCMPPASATGEVPESIKDARRWPYWIANV